MQSDDFKELIGMTVYPKTIIDDVKIEGANDISDTDRDRLIATIKSREFGPDEDGLSAAEGVIQGFWQDRGYFKVNVSMEQNILQSASTFQHLALVIRVDEGAQYRLHDIHFRNQDADTPLEFPPEQLRRLIPLEDGEIFRAETIRDGMEALKHLYMANGYIDFLATPETEFNEASHTISVVMVLDQEHQFRIGEIEFAGGHQQAQQLLKSRFKQNEIYNPFAVDDFFRQNARLLPAGISQMDVVTTRDQQNGTVSLVFDLRDCPR